MHYIKEKRTIERIRLSGLNTASIEHKGTLREVTILNASEVGVCISGPSLPVGSVVRLYIEPQKNDLTNISLYCKTVWSREDGPVSKQTGLSLLHTNKILFKQDLESFTSLVDLARIDEDR